MVPHYHVSLHTIFGKRLMTYNEKVGYSVLCEATFMGKKTVFTTPIMGQFGRLSRAVEGAALTRNVMVL